MFSLFTCTEISTVWRQLFFILINVNNVIKLKAEFNKKYFGNNTFCTLPKACLGNEKYSAKPETNVIHI